MLASAKVRAGVASWCELRTTGTHFTSSPDGGASIAEKLGEIKPKSGSEARKAANKGKPDGTEPGAGIIK